MFPFIFGGVVEQGSTHLMYKWEDKPDAVSVKAEMEYIEYSGRAISPCTTF